MGLAGKGRRGRFGERGSAGVRGADVKEPEQVSPAPDSLEDLLRRVLFFRSLDRVDIARLIGALQKSPFPSGALIFSEGAKADALYLLESGTVEVTAKAADGERTLAVVEAPAHFGELGLLLPGRTGSARAATDVQAWKLPRHRFDEFVRERPAVGLAVAASLARLVDERSRQYVGAPPAAWMGDPMAQEPRAGRPLPWRIAGAALAAAPPVALWTVAPIGGLSVQGWHVSLIVLGATLAWLFQIVPDFIVALAMATAWGLTGLVPVSVAFAGFGSSTWVIALGAVGLATAMARSGLLFRLVLILLRIFPKTPAGLISALLGGGVLTTPIVPMAAARIAMASLLTHELARDLDYVRSRASAALAFAALIGYTSFSSVFLTGLATNFFVLGLLPSQDRGRFDWLTWLWAAGPTGAVMLAGAFVALLAFVRTERPPKITAEALQRQRRALGPLSPREIVTIAALALLFAGLLFQPVIRIDTAWLTTTALVIILAGGVIDRASFRGSIEWGFLVLFGVLVGSGDVFHRAGIDRWIAEGLIPLARAVGNPGVFVVVLGAIVAASRLVLPRVPSNFLLALALVPAAPQLGLAPWLVGFVVLTVGNTWVLPNLSDFYALTRDITKREMFTDREGVIAGVMLTLLTLLAIAVSVPYWRAIGLLNP